MAAFALSLTLVGCSDRSIQRGDPAAGRVFADRECKGCHGLDGRGAGPAIPNLAAQRGPYLHLALTAYREGRRTHAALKALAGRMSDADARNVVAFYAGLPPVKGEGQQASFSPYEAGEELARDCVTCHGDKGNSTRAGVPSLAGQQPRYVVVAIQEYLAGLRETAPMHGLVRYMNQIERESVALYFASQVPAPRSAPEFGDAARGEPSTAVCGGCHGIRGVSTDTATPSVAGQDARYLVESMMAYGKGRRHEVMQRAVAQLSRTDIENIAAFYTVQRAEPAAHGPTLVSAQIEKCNRCHAADVNSPMMAIPKINGQDKEYLAMALRAYRDEKRASTLMHTMSMPYSDSVIESLASFYSRQPPS
jgi:cytochrome c553